MTEENGKAKEKKDAISLYLDEVILDLLESKANELRRSKSWIANESLRHDFGLPPGQ